MPSYKDKDIQFNNIDSPQVLLGMKLGRNEYVVDDQDNIISKPDPIVNAIDIDWNNAQLNDKIISTTADLLDYIKNHSGESSIPESDIIRIMLSAIRLLQSEVTKLRNSFRFGINSYTDENFGMSQTVDELKDIPEEEPLWATDESELSFIDGLDLSQESYQYIVPVENYHILPNDKLSYNNTISFIVPEDSDSKTILETLKDPKQYAYLTVSTKNVNVIFKSEDKEIIVNINDIVKYQYAPDKYNILVIVSKKVEYKESLVGNNFIWISVSEWGTGTDLFNGYIDAEGHVDYDNSETPIYLDDIYNISEIEFNTDSEDYIYKLDIYSKYQDMSSTVEAATPTDVEDYKYRTAAITIRSMSTFEKIEENVNQLQNNELIFCEANKKLYIYTNGKLINIGKGGEDTTPEEDIMENYEILKALEAQGLINITFVNSDLEPEDLKYDPANIKEYIMSNKVNISDSLNAIEKINFINGDTGKSFNVTMSPYGEFDIREQDDNSMAKYMTKTNGESYYDDLPDDYKTDRSFISILKATKKNIDITKDMKLNADRIQIGATYVPLKTDKIHGCTHAYIELMNTSNEDFYLDGSYLHYSYVENASSETTADQITYKSLALDGFIPAGGTYLIRCKQYSTIDDPNTFIDIKTYDKEWYDNGELLDLSISTGSSLGLALTYGNTVSGSPITPATQFAQTKPASPDSTYKLSGKGTWVLAKGFIDAFYIGGDWGSKGHWVAATKSQGSFNISSNTIYKITFELDPAKQAFNSFTTSDSSRTRWQNSGTDFQYLNLDREYIEFPKTPEIKKAVADYTPKASFEHKNVITDKTKLDKTKPNAIVCSFGIDPYTTRCFNWVSSGLFNEAVVIIDQENNKHIFESYTTITEEISEASTEMHRKEFPVDVNNAVYARIYNTFPGNNEPYASHKCIVNIVNNGVSEPTTYKYFVCRLDKFGNIDESYKSEERSFTLYPKTYQPRIYQITDQQGFHWVEYQVWAAAAKELNEKITEDINKENIMPIIVNTGDCVQSGARVNEWLDYFIAGDYLFNKYEQMNVVGNNDLCDTNINALGTGDDTGKSNGYFFHLFNCYEIPTDEYRPIINGVYVPSLYYMEVVNGDKQIKLLFINSEITMINCRDWFNLKVDDVAVNIYTGYTISTPQQYVAEELNFHPIYEILYQWTNDNKTYLPICHEMPFTVVTNACLSWTANTNEYSKFRSLSDASALIGSHTNQIDKSEKGKGMHWMSRLFEFRHITLCLGGHKHTYACTYPARENYLYTEEGEQKWSYKDGAMTMPESLKDDTAVWTINIQISGEVNERTINLSKFPIVKRQAEHKLLDINVNEYEFTYNEKTIKIKVSDQAPLRFYPFIDAEEGDNNSFVTYLMCQATGYKLTSNKELPSEFQKFSMVIPKSYIDGTSDKPSSDQQMPMFTIIDLIGNNTYYTQLGRIDYISNSRKKMEFTQLAYNKGLNNQLIEYLVMAKTSINGLWAYYNSKSGNFKQTDTYDGSKINLHYIEGTTDEFNVSNNEEFILYPDLVTPDNIYLFVLDSTGLKTTK